MKDSFTIVVTALLLLTFGAVGMRVAHNQAEWTRDGFYGFPVRVMGTDAMGRPVEVVLRESRRMPLPSAASQWRYAVSEISTDLIKQFKP